MSSYQMMSGEYILDAKILEILGHFGHFGGIRGHCD